LDEIPPEKITEVRLALKRRLIRYLRSTQSQEFIAKENPSENNAKDDIFFDENALFIGFARRMVEYKRPLLIFSDPKKLSALLNQADKPVFLFIAGKAHPQDEKGIALIKSISEFIQKPEFNKRVFFLEDYDMEIAKILVQGVDLWLNTPSRGLEASGTSGMKAMLNGVLNLSTMDGWWEEAYHESIGWAIPPAPDSPSTDQALRFESEMLYRLLEKEIIPTFFQKKKNGFSDVWISKIKASMKKSESYSFSRTLSEYNTLYHRLYRRYTALANHEFEDLKKFIKWKKHLIQSWSQLDVISVDCSKTQNGGTDLVQTRVALDIADLSIDDLGVEVFFKWNDLATKQPKQFFKELQVSACDRNRVTFELTLTDLHSGHYNYSFRIFPKHPMLEKKQDFDLVKWI
jgi:glucan phosphorylase